MLEIRPNCECCDKDLPPSSTQACICSYECTFCADCVEEVLFNVCPNCGGGFTRRPIRPVKEYRPGLNIHHQKPSIQRINTKYTADELVQFCGSIKQTRPENR